MTANGSLAIIPKARGMYAKRISMAEYEELMRRRTVPEVTALLKKHTYFKDSLATLSTAELHRGQLEELLSTDIFQKYEALVHYDFSKDSFSHFYLDECEIREIVKAMHLISIGQPGIYLKRIPAYLVGKTSVDLFALGQARNFQELVEALRHTSYYKAAKAAYDADPDLLDFPLAEAAMVKESFKTTFRLADKSFSGREKEAVESLFLQEAEIHNLQLIFRVKAFFPNAYTSKEIHQLLLPYRIHVSRQMLNAMVEAADLNALMALFRQSSAIRYAGSANMDDITISSGKVLYHHAMRLLRLTSSPAAALAAFVTLSKLERDNVVNVIEGVRYGLRPEKIRALLWY